MSGNVYKYYYDDLYFKKKSHINKHNGYIYVNITCKDGKNRSRRLHVLMAKTFLFNPNPKKYKIVGHKDNDKSHYELSNLYWTDNQENTQKAVDDGLNIFKKAINKVIYNAYIKNPDKWNSWIYDVIKEKYDMLKKYYQEAAKLQEKFENDQILQKAFILWNKYNSQKTEENKEKLDNYLNEKSR